MSLADLETADWSDIDDGVYGSPDEVLALLRALAMHGADGDVSVDDLCSEIFHQGDVYETTVRSIPYLIELIWSEEALHRQLHIELLVWLAILWDGRGTDYNRPNGGNSRRDSHVPAITAAVKSAIREGLPAYRKRLEDSRENVPNAACMILGCLKEDADHSAPLIRERYESADDPVRQAALLLCYGRLATNAERQAFVMPRFADTSLPGVVRTAAAVVLAETPAHPLNSAISGMPCNGQSSPPPEIRDYLENLQKEYGTPRNQNLAAEFYAVTCGLETLDAALDDLLHPAV